MGVWLHNCTHNELKQLRENDAKKEILAQAYSLIKDGLIDKNPYTDIKRSKIGIRCLQSRKLP
jgi:hypothetical protein